MCLSFSVTALSWAGFLKGFIPPSMTQDIQFAHAETAISRKDCQENPLIFFFLLWEFCGSILKEQECDKHLLLHDLFDLFSVFGPKTEAFTKFKWQLFFTVQGEFPVIIKCRPINSG